MGKAALIPYRVHGSDIFICLLVPKKPTEGGLCPQIAKMEYKSETPKLDAAILAGKTKLGYERRSGDRILFLGTMFKIDCYYVKVSAFDIGVPEKDYGHVLWFTVDQAMSAAGGWNKKILTTLYTIISKEIS